MREAFNPKSGSQHLSTGKPQIPKCGLLPDAALEPGISHRLKRLIIFGLLIAYLLPVSFSTYHFISKLNTSINSGAIFGMVILWLIIGAIILLVVNHILKWSESLEKERYDLKSQLYHAHKLVSVGQLAGGVAHEINNPLAIIASEAGLIRDMLNPEMGVKPAPELLIKELDEIDKAVYRAKNITQKILKFVRKNEPKVVSCNVAQVLEDVVASVKEQEFKVSNIELVRDYDPEVPPVKIDPDLMRQVFLNLINNASDAVGEGDTITLRTRRENDVVKITVADTGQGMDTKQLEKVFLPFYTTKKAGKGTGLGLPISLAIVKDMGGWMDAESKPGEGAAFTVVFPLKKK
jgi:two-component system NtrC family sensor kinase